MVHGIRCDVLQARIANRLGSGGLASADDKLAEARQKALQLPSW
jgi:hypothetical protein